MYIVSDTMLILDLRLTKAKHVFKIHPNLSEL